MAMFPQGPDINTDQKAKGPRGLLFHMDGTVSFRRGRAEVSGP